MKTKIINLLIKILKVDTNKISDGYHTFEELYEHRIRLYIALCRQCRQLTWRSKKHSDGTSIPGWFIIGINTRKWQQITYHIPMRYWHVTNDFRTIAKAYTYDGHTPEDVLYRITNLYTQK